MLKRLGFCCLNLLIILFLVGCSTSFHKKKTAYRSLELISIYSSSCSTSFPEHYQDDDCLDYRYSSSVEHLLTTSIDSTETATNTISITNFTKPYLCYLEIFGVPHIIQFIEECQLTKVVFYDSPFVIVLMFDLPLDFLSFESIPDEITISINNDEILFKTS